MRADDLPTVRCVNAGCPAKQPSKSGIFPGTDIVMGRYIHLSGSKQKWLCCIWCNRAKVEMLDQTPYINKMRKALQGL